VHWIDPTSLELLTLVVDRAPNLPLLLAVTFRPEFTPPWLGRPYVEHVRLDRLPRGGSAEMIANLTRGRTLSSSTVEEIIDRTEGVPLSHRRTDAGFAVRQKTSLNQGDKTDRPSVRRGKYTLAYRFSTE